MKRISCALDLARLRYEAARDAYRDVLRGVDAWGPGGAFSVLARLWGAIGVVMLAGALAASFYILASIGGAFIGLSFVAFAANRRAVRRIEREVSIAGMELDALEESEGARGEP